MKAVLIVVKDRVQVKKIELTEDVFAIGRTKGNLTIPDELVSSNHARITREGRDFYVEDLKSRNGTSVDGKALKRKQILRDGQEIKIGETRLKFVLDGDAESSADEEDDRTRVAGENVRNVKRQSSKRRDPDEAMHVKLTIVEGRTIKGVTGKVFQEDWGDVLTIGRSDENDMVLNSDTQEGISRQHAEIVRKENKFYIRDLESDNCTFVDGRKVTEERLRNGQTIRIGEHILKFEMVDLAKRKKAVRGLAIAVLVLCLGAVSFHFLKPPDRITPLIAAGRKALEDGNYADAAAKAQLVLQFDPASLDGKRLLDRANTEIQIVGMLAEAKELAGKEQYSEARDKYYVVQRLQLENQTAKQGLAILEKIQLADVAIKATNWSGAIEALESAKAAFPKSALVQKLLESSKRERVAQVALRTGFENLAAGNADAAAESFKQIEATSLYFASATNGLGEVAVARSFATAMAEARESYSAGNIAGAIAILNARPATKPGLDDAATRLLARYQKMAKLSQEAERAAKEIPSDDSEVAALLEARTKIDSALKFEDDPNNESHKQMQRLLQANAAHLKKLSEAKFEVARSLAGERDKLAKLDADALQAPANLLQAQTLRTAMEAAKAASMADASNQEAAALAEDVRKKFETVCTTLYNRGIALRDVKDEVSRAKAAACLDALRKVIRPGDKYFASLEKLK